MIADYEELYYHLQIYPEIRIHLDIMMAEYESQGKDPVAFRDGFLECFMMKHKSDQEEIYEIARTIATSTSAAEITKAVRLLKEINKNQPFKKYHNV